MLTVLSLGAGVQSSTLALMAAAGEITPMPDAAIFADTQAEPDHVYEWLNWLEKQLPFPIHRVTAGSLFDVIGKKRPSGKWSHMPLPAFVLGKDGKGALLNRSCTQDYKIKPIRRKLRELLGLTRRKSPSVPVVTQWIGISADEAQRARPAREAWVQHRWPLLERGITRLDCLQWMERKGYPKPVKSSCTFCPFHDNAQWYETQSDQNAWAQALEIDGRIRKLRAGQRNANEVFLHRSLIPLKDLRFKLIESEPDLFDEKTFAVECEGICGV